MFLIKNGIIIRICELLYSKNKSISNNCKILFDEIITHINDIDYSNIDTYNDKQKMNIYISLIYMYPKLENGDNILFDQNKGVIYLLLINNSIHSSLTMDILYYLPNLGIDINYDIDSYKPIDLCKNGNLSIKIGIYNKVILFNDNLKQVSHLKRIPVKFDVDYSMLKLLIECYKNEKTMNRV